MNKEYKKYIISDRINIREALVALNNLSSDTLTLFVVNDMFEMIGTVTDGDIRRKLIQGVSLDNSVVESMHKDFSYLEEDNISIQYFNNCRKCGITLLPCLNAQKQIIRVYNLNKQSSILPIDAVLMAGGKGERLRPLTEQTPKPLLPVGGKAIIDYNIDRLCQFGVKNISVTINYLGDQIEKHFENPCNGIKVQCVREPKFLGTMGSIKYVKSFENDTVLMMNSDLFTNINYEDFFLHFKENNADMSIAAVPYSVSIPYGIFDLEGRNIKGVKEKPSYNYYANAGIYLIKKDLLELIPKDEFFNATDFLELLLNKGFSVIRFPIVGNWIDIGKHEDYVRAQELVKHL